MDSRDILFRIFHPHLGAVSRHETLDEVRRRGYKIKPDQAQSYWQAHHNSSRRNCSHVFWHGRCIKTIAGVQCEVSVFDFDVVLVVSFSFSAPNRFGIVHILTREFCSFSQHGMSRRKYTILSGSIFAVWSRIERLLRGTQQVMQVIRLKTMDGSKIVGVLLPQESVDDIIDDLTEDSVSVKETIFLDN